MIGAAPGITGTVTVTGEGATWNNQEDEGILYVGFQGKGALNIKDGGTVSSTFSVVGAYEGSSGAVTVAGAGSTWNNANLLSVGNGGDGTLDIKAGGAVSGLSGYIGVEPGVTGKVTVSGEEARWNNGEDLLVGYQGAGTLTIEEGGAVTNGAGSIGSEAGSTGTVTVSNATWSNRGALYVGKEGEGELQIADGGTVRNSSGRIGLQPGSTGTVSVSDASWINEGDLNIGDYGNGRLDIDSGGTVTNTSGVIGYHLDSNSMVTVTAATWANSGALNVGFSGTGNLTINAGGEVRAGGNAAIGTRDTSTGTAMVTGEDALWDNEGSLSVGYEGQGTLDIKEGGMVTNGAGYLGYADTSRGRVTVSNATWANEGDLSVGYYGNGTLDIEDGSTLTSEAGYVGYLLDSTGEATVTAGATWTNSGGLSVGFNGTGALTVASGGAVDSTYGYIATDTGSTGTVTVTGEGSRWTSGDALSIGNIGTGTLTVAAGGAVSASQMTLATWDDSTGTINIGAAAGESAVAAGTLDTGSIAFGRGIGTLTFNHTGTNHLFAAALESVNDGTHALDHLSGTTLLTGDSSGFAGITTVAGGILLVGDAADNGTLGGRVIVQDGGTLGGSGTVGSGVDAGSLVHVSSGGTLAPGNSIGTLTVDGDLALTEGAILEYDLGAPGTPGSPGTSDRIDVTGNLDLDGTLNLAQSQDAADGAAGLGYYRLMTYGGDLTGSGLEIGDTLNLAEPARYEVLSGDGTVDLFIAALGDDMLQHWQGGDGIWDANNEQWLNIGGGAAPGDLPVTWAGNHAVFKNEPGGFDGGTITVAGPQSFAGLQFVDDGYRLEGDGTLVTATDGSEIRVLADRAEIATEITGPGGIVKTEGGTLVLEGQNSYQGGTTILDGAVQVSEDANLGDTSGGLTLNGGTLATTDSFDSGRVVTLAGDGGFDVTGNTTLELSGDIGGNGNLVKTGDGILLLTGDNSGFDGTTSVTSGRLLVGGADGNGVLGGSLDVLDGSALDGTGTVGSGADSRVTIASGGTLAPGAPIGTLTVDGDLIFAPGSNFLVEVNPAGADSDLVVVSGTARLNGGSVTHIGADGDYNFRSTYTILTAGTLEGTFEGVTSDFAFLTPDLIYDYEAGSVELELLRNDREFASLAVAPNQIATARAIDSIGFDTGHAVFDAIAQLGNGADLIRASFDALSGEIHASGQSALIEDSRFVRNAANDRVRAAFGGAGASGAPVLAFAPGAAPVEVAADHAGPVYWSRGFGSWGSTGSDGNAARLERNIGGMLFGADTDVGDWRLGVLAGYSHSRFVVSDRAASGSSENYHLGLYGGTQWGNLTLRTGAAYTWHDIGTNRSVSIPGFSDSLSSAYSASTFQAFGELGYGIERGDTRFEPFIGLAHVSLNTDGHGENGGDAALSANGGTNSVTFTTLGLHAEHNMMLGPVDATLRGTLGWQHSFGDLTPESTHAFSAGDDFTIAGVPIAQDAAVIEAGLDFNLSPNATFGLSYTGQIASGASDHGVRFDLNVKF